MPSTSSDITMLCSMGVECTFSDNFKRTTGSVIAREFLSRTAEATFSTIKEYGDSFGWSDSPFFYRERNLYSHISAAVNQLTRVHMSEVSIDREGNNGRVDLWAYYRKTHFAIECKKTNINIKPKAGAGPGYGEIGYVRDSWASVCGQAASALKTVSEWRGASERIVSCGMLFALPWTRRQSAADEYAPDELNDALKAQLPNVDFIASMDLENPHFTFDVNGKKVQEFIPRLYILGRVLFGGIDAGEAKG